MDIPDSASPQEDSFRTRVHRMLRTAILDAAWERAARLDWADVRIADLADDVGVSRQTIYNEFGAKDQLGAALFRREMEGIQVGVLAVTAEAPDFRSAMHASLVWMLAEARKNPVLERVLSAAREGSRESLLPMLTVRADLMILPLRSAVAEAYLLRWPGTSVRRAELVADLLIRFGLSQLILPSDFPEETVIDQIVDMAASSARLLAVD